MGSDIFPTYWIKQYISQLEKYSRRQKRVKKDVKKESLKSCCMVAKIRKLKSFTWNYILQFALLDIYFLLQYSEIAQSYRISI